jgi:hypothetical protein
MAELQPIAGQVVRVTTLRLGGEPMHVPYIVAEPDPAKAEQLVAAGYGPQACTPARSQDSDRGYLPRPGKAAGLSSVVS